MAAFMRLSALLVPALALGIPSQVGAQRFVDQIDFPTSRLTCPEVETRAQEILMGKILKLSKSDLLRNMGKSDLDVALINSAFDQTTSHDFALSYPQKLEFGQAWRERCETSRTRP